LWHRHPRGSGRAAMAAAVAVVVGLIDAHPGSTTVCRLECCPLLLVTLVTDQPFP